SLLTYHSKLDMNFILDDNVGKISSFKALILHAHPKTLPSLRIKKDNLVAQKQGNKMNLILALILMSKWENIQCNNHLVHKSYIGVGWIASILTQAQ
ncbi:hypothetical protein Lal_00004656, partial [Lupinus albus]